MINGQSAQDVVDKSLHEVAIRDIMMPQNGGWR